MLRFFTLGLAVMLGPAVAAMWGARRPCTGSASPAGSEGPLKLRLISSLRPVMLREGGCTVVTGGGEGERSMALTWCWWRPHASSSSCMTEHRWHGRKAR